MGSKKSTTIVKKHTELIYFIRTIKVRIFPFLALLLHSVGFSWGWIGEKLGHYTVLAQMRRLENGSKNEEQVKEQLNVLLFAYLGVFTTNNVVQILIGKVLQRRGHNVSVLLADRILPLCETTDIHRHKYRIRISKYFMNYNEKLFKYTGFKVIKLSQIISQERWIELGNIKNDNRWDQYVDSMLLRYLKVGKIDLNDSFTKEIYKRGRHAALISEEIGKYIVSLKPDRVSFAHGTYTSRGPAKDIINQANIPAFSVSRGKMAESQKFNWKTSGDWWDVSNEWEKIKDIPLDEQEEVIIDDYLSSRFNHKRDIIVYNHSEVESSDQLRKKLELNPEQKVYTLFTNVLWDAASAQREIAFDNALQWVKETIEYFIENKKDQLVVRIHPAESIIGTNQPIIKFIEDTFTKLTSNIKIIDSSADVNSWSLLKVTDIGLVHTSTVGMELALEGIPCVCLSKTHYRGKGFTIDVESKEEYFDILRNGVSLDSEQMRILAKRYAFLLFPRYQFHFPFISPHSHMSIKSLKEVNLQTISEHPSMRTIVKSIEQKSDFLLSSDQVKKMY